MGQVTPSLDRVTIKQIENLNGVEAVLFTSIGCNISEIINESFSEQEKAEILANLAIASVTGQTFPKGSDGIRYLDAASRSGVTTRLSEAYTQAVLRLTAKSANLEEARLWVAKDHGIIP